MPAEPLEALEMRTMTAVVDKRHIPRMPLTAIMFGGVRENILTTETVQIDQLVGSYEMADFVHKDGKPTTVTRENFDSYTIETPCIKQEVTLSDSNILLERRAGVINLDAGGKDYIRESALIQINRDIQKMEAAYDLRFEWMISNLLLGVISYTNTDTGASFTISTNKPAGNTYTVANLWDVEAGAPLLDIADVNRLAHENFGPAPTIGLCGRNAADAVRLRLSSGWDTAIKTDSGVAAGSGTLEAEWKDLGAVFIARLGGVDFWEVSAQLTDSAGVTAPVIRDDYVEFIPNSARGRGDRVVHYGRKRSAKAVNAGLAIGKFFARSWIDENADVWKASHQGRPLPFLEHSEWLFSLKVV